VLAPSRFQQGSCGELGLHFLVNMSHSEIHGTFFRIPICPKTKRTKLSNIRPMCASTKCCYTRFLKNTRGGSKPEVVFLRGSDVFLCVLRLHGPVDYCQFLRWLQKTGSIYAVHICASEACFFGRIRLSYIVWFNMCVEY